jgi:organic hydroperoxide reductase OsmC/OhrA
MAMRLEPKVKIPGLHHWQLQTLHDLNHSLCEYVMSLQCDKVIHQLLEGGLVARMSVSLG